MRRLRGTLLATVTAATLGSAAPAHAAPALAEVGKFEKPMYVAAPPGDTRSFVVVEREGTMQLVEDGVVAGTPFADLRDRVSITGERGLLSAAFRPDYATTGLVYVYFTARGVAGYTSGDLVIEELRRDPANPRRVDPAYRRTVLRIPHPAANHNGGQVAFGPDGHLYVATGDGGGSDDPENDGQNTNNLLGKMLRIDPDAGNGCGGSCTIPADNPFAGGGGAREVWAYGLRNPWRFSFDRATGDLVIADVGQDTIEEINVARAATGLGRGANYGWPCMEGDEPNTPTSCPEPANHTKPLIQKRQPDWVSITGGVVVRDPNVPSLGGRLLFTDYTRGTASEPFLAARLGIDEGLPTTLFSPSTTSISEDGCGRVYVTSVAGPVRRIVENHGGICGAPTPGQPGTGPGTTPVDRTVPTLRLYYGRRQRTLKTGRITLLARCDELCRLRITSKFSPRHGSPRAASRMLARNARVRFTVRLSRKVRRALRRDARRGRRVVARVSVRATDTAGNARTRTVRIRLKR